MELEFFSILKLAFQKKNNEEDFVLTD